MREILVICLISNILSGTFFYFKGSSDKDEELTTKYTTAYLEQDQFYRKIERENSEKRKEIDYTYMGELLDERENTDRILNTIDSSKPRVFKQPKETSCPTTTKTGTGASMDDAAKKRESDKRLARETVETLGICRESIIQLKAFQELSKNQPSDKLLSK